ncbi:hypothetical protein IFM89_019033 [Coptis chinensis]|uniref:RING-type E3 ubiquitin transferase n=1 Tax=Coptis chinensis TaxID=261450 RepID=A0A835LS49_9MAGN|nr:hypothetical protein IFM89_019033 [Coptis chinensis]
MDDVENIGGGQGIVGAGEMIRRNAENVAARLEMQAARLEAQVEQMFDGLDDVDGAEDVPFDKLVGMQGPAFHLVENAFTILPGQNKTLGVPGSSLVESLQVQTGTAIVMKTVRNTVDTGEEAWCAPFTSLALTFLAFDESVNGVPKIQDGYNLATWMLVVTTAAQEEETILHRRRLLEQRYYGYTKAIAKAIELLDELVEEGSEIMDVRNKDEVVLRMKVVVASKQYGQEDILCPLIADVSMVIIC